MEMIRNKSKLPEYRIWVGMKQRCYNINSSSYKYYGEKGISICKRWMTFEFFYKDMGQRPKGLSIDRIDNEGNYSPENCRWATSMEQAENTRRANIEKSMGVIHKNTRTQVMISKMVWGKFKLIFGIKGIDKSEAMTEALHLYNDKHKKVLE